MAEDFFCWSCSLGCGIGLDVEFALLEFESGGR
jgi:hypothetical protein